MNIMSYPQPKVIDYIMEALDHSVVPDYIAVGKHRIELIGVTELIR